MAERSWRIAYGVLTAIFILTAALNLAHVRAGFLTSHAADLCVPAWLYIASRGLAGSRRGTLLVRWIGKTPETAAGSLFVASALTELSQVKWPRGLFSGTYDPLDLLAYAIGLSACYVVEKLQLRRARLLASPRC